MIKAELVSVRSLAGAAALIAGLMAAFPAPAWAQESNVSIGAPQLREFQLEPTRRIVTQPRPQPAEPAPATSQPATRPTAEVPRPQLQPQGQPGQQPRTAPAQRTVRAPAPTPTAAPSTTAPTTDAPAVAPSAGDVAPVVAAPLPAPAAPATDSSAPLSDGPPLWMFFLAFVTVGLLGYGYWLRRQAAERRALAVAGSAPAAAPVVEAPRPPAGPRPDPIPRPWLDISLVPERATIDLDESIIEFELTVRNTGGSVAQGVKLQARFFCSTDKQDQELAAYFKAKPGDYKTLTMPDIPAGGEIVMKGTVDITRDRISALKMDNKLLFVPLIGVNAFYAWSSTRSGQTSKSFVIGREAVNDNERMGPFRLDLGARVYRTLGQRPHKVSKRV